MNKIWVFLVLIFFSASAAAFPASLDVEDRSASPDDPAVFYVDIQNDLNEAGLFEVGAFTPKPSWFYIESSRSLEPGENHSFKITVTPGEYAVDQSYSFTLYPRSSAVQHSHEIQTSFRVDRQREIILEDLNLNKTAYDPGETVNGEAKIRSISSSLLREYRLTAAYENQSTDKTSSPILPGGTRTLSFKLPIDPESEPREHNLNTSLYLEGEKVEQASTEFTVGEIKEIKVNTTSTNNLAITTGTVTVQNRGNTPINHTINKTVPSYLTPITAFNKEPQNQTQKASNTVYYFTEELQPSESFTVERQTNYWMPATALLGIIAALAGLRKLRNTVKIQKTAEKTASGLKVSIEVENISDRTFRDVKVNDFVPDIASVEKNFEMASPTVRETNDGTKLEWSLEDLEPGDQRVLQYTIRPKVEVEEGVELPKAELKEGDKVLKKSKEFTSEFNP